MDYKKINEKEKKKKERKESGTCLLFVKTSKERKIRGEIQFMTTVKKLISRTKFSIL